MRKCHRLLLKLNKVTLLEYWSFSFRLIFFQELGMPKTIFCTFISFMCLTLYVTVIDIARPMNRRKDRNGTLFTFGTNKYLYRPQLQARPNTNGTTMPAAAMTSE